MLDPESTWVDEFKKLKPASTPIAGITALADVIEKLTNKVDPKIPGGMAQPGIFKWNKAIFIAQMLTQQPTQGPDWVAKMAGAWSAACNAGVITPGLVTASIWTVSSKDTLTVPLVPATIPTVAAGQAAIMGILSTMPAVMAADPEGGPEVFGKAFFAGVSAFTFILIGIAGTPVSPVPTPVPGVAS